MHSHTGEFQIFSAALPDRRLHVKTVYEWIAKGRLNGAFRKRGKHHLIWRDRALDLIFNGADWNE